MRKKRKDEDRTEMKAKRWRKKSYESAKMKKERRFARNEAATPVLDGDSLTASALPSAATQVSSCLVSARIPPPSPTTQVTGPSPCPSPYSSPEVQHVLVTPGAKETEQGSEEEKDWRMENKLLYTQKVDENTLNLRGVFGWEGDEADLAEWKRRHHRRHTRTSPLRSVSGDIGSQLSQQTEDNPPPKKTACFRKAFRCILGCFTGICRYVHMICPPLPRPILRKAAFPAPRCSYAFHTRQGDGLGFRIEPTDAKTQKKLGGILRRAAIFEAQGFYARTSLGNTIAGFYLPPIKLPPTCTILYSHGNAMDLGHCLPTAYKLRRKLNAAVVAYDFSGYGLSSGKTSEAGLVADAEAAYDWAVKERGTSPATTILFGFSLGSYASVCLAVKRPEIRGLVLAGAFASGCNAIPCLRGLCCGSCIRTKTQRSRCSCDVLLTANLISDVQQKTLVIHGLQDTLVGLKNSFFLIDNLPSRTEPLFLLGATHNDLEDKPGLYHGLIRYAVELGLTEPWAELRSHLREVFLNKVPNLHAECADSVHGDCCDLCRKALLASFVNDIVSIKDIGLEPEDFKCPQSLVLMVEPRRQWWSGYFAITVAAQAPSLRTVRSGRWHPVPHPPNPDGTPHSITHSTSSSPKTP